MRGMLLLVVVAVGCAGLMAAREAAAEDAPAEQAKSGEGGELKELRAQVTRLAETLASVRKEADALKSRMAAVESGRYAPAALKPAGIGEGAAVAPRLLDVNGDLRMVVIDAGSQRGMGTGARFAVVREDRTIAEIQVVDVREKIAGAAIVSMQKGMFPALTDGLTRIAGPGK